MSSWKSATALTLALLAPLATADVPAASAAELAWFEGRWATGPADVPGHDTIAAEAPDCQRAVSIRRSGQDRLERSTTLRDGSTHIAEFEIRKFGGNYPWWPVSGQPGPVAKRTGDNVFVLAPTDMGRAQWDRALQHTRCPD